MEHTWIPLVLAAAGVALSAYLTVHQNSRAKQAQAAAEAELQHAIKRRTELQIDLRRLKREAAAVSAESASAKEHDLAMRLAEIASELEAESAQLAPLETTGEVDH
jgi:peptidoglycan hydrolase CwlO-like protein